MTYQHVVTLVCFYIVSIGYLLQNDVWINFIPIEVVYPELWNYPTRQGVETELELEHCDCVRRLTRVNESVDHNVHYNSTTCGQDAYSRGPNQKVVSFTFFHGARAAYEKNKKKFFEGIIENLALVRQLYGNGWTMRLYYDLDPGPAGQQELRQLCDLACSNPQLDLCNMRSLPAHPFTLKDASEVYPLLWRYFPTLDLQVREAWPRIV